MGLKGNHSLKSLLPGLVTFFLIIALIIVYKKNSLGDAGYYVKNGGEILSRVNPYETGYRSGPLGGVFLNLTLGRIPLNAAEIILMVSCLLGSTIFTIVLFPNLQKIVYSLVPITVLFSAHRELLVNHQINGIILILLSGYWLLIRLPQRSALFIGTLSAAIAVDLKPHIAAPILVALFLAERKLKSAVVTLSWLTISHLICNLWLGTITEVRWLQNLFEISNNNSWADVANIWPLVGASPLLESHVKYFATFTFLSSLVIIGFSSFKGKFTLSIIIALGTPVVGMYCHLYDLGAFILLSLALSESRKRGFLLYLFVNFAIVFKSVGTHEGVALLFIANLIFFIYRKVRLQVSNRIEFRSIALAIVAYSTLQFGVSHSFLSNNESKSLIICVIVLIGFLLIFSSKLGVVRKH